MPYDIERFEEVVDRRSQFYESIDIRTISVKQNSKWHNLHTDVYLRPQEPESLLSSTETLEPAAYFRTAIPFDDFRSLFRKMFGKSCSIHDEPVVFPGLLLEEGEKHWKENVYRANYLGEVRADDAYGISIQSNTQDPLKRKDEVREELRKCNPPYYDIDDLSKEFIGHTSYRWDNPRARFFAPLYVQITEMEITEKGDLKLSVETHDSIEELKISTWARKNHEIIDRESYYPVTSRSSEGPFGYFDIDWEIDGNPTSISASIFHPSFDELRESTKVSSSVPMLALEAVLGMTSEELAAEFDQVLTNPDVETLDNVEFADDFEATVITLFNLSGFATYSPDWFDYKTTKGSLPDVLAFAREANTLVVCECTLETRDAKLKGKAEDALSTAQDVKDHFEELNLRGTTVLSVCATPTDNVSSQILPDDVEILTGPRLKKMRQQAEQRSNPMETLREWGTYDERPWVL